MDGRCITLTIEIRLRRWVRWYVYGLVITSRVTGMEPDQAKVARTLGWMLRHGGVVLVLR